MSLVTAAALLWSRTRHCPLGTLDLAWDCSRRSRNHLPIELDQLIEFLESRIAAGHFFLHVRHDVGNGLCGKSHQEPTSYRTKSRCKQISLILRLYVMHPHFLLSAILIRHRSCNSPCNKRSSGHTRAATKYP